MRIQEAGIERYRRRVNNKYYMWYYLRQKYFCEEIGFLVGILLLEYHFRFHFRLIIQYALKIDNYQNVTY